MRQARCTVRMLELCERGDVLVDVVTEMMVDLALPTTDLSMSYMTGLYSVCREPRAGWADQIRSGPDVGKEG